MEGVSTKVYGKCSRPCGGGKRYKSYMCAAPKVTNGATCYMDNCATKERTIEKCNTNKCEGIKTNLLVLTVLANRSNQYN